MGSITQTRLRMGLCPLLLRLYRILELPLEAAMCPICLQGHRDDTRHFIGARPAFARERAKLQQQVRTNMFLLGKPGALVLSQLQDDPEAWFDTVLGAKMRIKLPNALPGTETHQFKAYATKAL